MCYKKINLEKKDRNIARKGLTAVQEYAEYDPDYKNTYRMHCEIGKIHSAIGNYDEDIIAFEKTVKVAPHESSKFAMERNIGHLYENQGKREEAIAMYEKIVSEHSSKIFGVSEVMLRLGSLYEEDKEYRKAIEGSAMKILNFVFLGTLFLLLVDIFPVRAEDLFKADWPIEVRQGFAKMKRGDFAGTAQLLETVIKESRMSWST
ncbi:MAG TPA: tetratricopeptide repeat protein [Candidatus Omnitrophica bacterium]|nr:tetratricopeptide repeat protein [Candidatus Omnitrophota bacterium]